MPCSIYKGKQQALCFATKEWKDWSKIRIKKKVAAMAKSNKKLFKKMKGGKKK